jgi:predicted RNA-binding Zn-ribbon protein involved in translation (DUF1610 family)
MNYFDIYKELTHKQTQELLKENFGTENSRYHTLDEIPLCRLLEKVKKNKCPICGKEYVLNIHGGGVLEDVWVCLDCYWEA